MVLCAACSPAATFQQGRLVVDPGFSVTEPDPARWKLVKNRRWNQQPLVVYRYQQRGKAALSLRVVHVPPDGRRVPLEVLAEGYFMTSGLAQGIEAHLDATLNIVVGEQPAVVCLGTWTLRPLSQRVAQVMLRSPDGLVVISLIAVPESFDQFAPDFDALLREFELVTRRPLDPFLLDEVPMEAPDQDPGHFGP